MKLSFISDIWRSRRSPLMNDSNFDPEFYKRNYRDLNSMSDEDLYRHYVSFGREEGRFPNLAAAISHYEELYGELLDGFDPKTYISLYSDLKEAGFTEAQAIEHYFAHGREEGTPMFF